MGFLDKQSRVVDIVLTEKGRKLYAAGKLDFTYFGLFDDGIDYDPYSTGSLTHEEREAIIENTPMHEAPFIPDVRGATAPMEPIHHLFTAGPDYDNIPHMLYPSDGDPVSLMADQRRTDGSYSRTGTSLAQIDMQVTGDSEPGSPGFIVRVFASGSNGLTAVDIRRDLSGRKSYDPFLAISVDDERPVDVPTVDRPNSARIAETRIGRKA